MLCVGGALAEWLELMQLQARRSLSSLHRRYPSRIAETNMGASQGDTGLHTQKASWKDS